MRMTRQFVAMLILANSYAIAAERPLSANTDAIRSLRLAEAAASGLRGTDRAYAYWLISRDYSGLDNKAQLEAAKKSCEASINSEPGPEDFGLRQKIELDCLRLLLIAQPKEGEKLLARAEPEVRQRIIAARAVKAASKGDIDGALAMLAQEVSQSARYPYSEAMNVMRALPAEDRASKDRILAQALSYYRVKNSRFDVGMDDLGTMVERFWRDLSPGLVLEAIDTLLDVAQHEATAESHLEVSMVSSAGAVGLSSLTQYRIFQLIAALRELDPARAQELSESSQQPDLLKKYPQGMSNLVDGPAGKDNGLSLTLHIKNGPATITSSSGDDLLLVSLQSRAEKILAEAGDDSDAALKDALALPDNLRKMQSVKADLILRIAAMSQESKPSQSVNALRELANIIKEFPPLAQSRYLVEMGDQYLRINDKAAAAGVIERGLKQVVLLYKMDTDSDDSNRALKSSWPSTVVSRAFISLSARISMKLSEETIKQVPDPDLQVFDRIELASTLLKIKSYPALMQEAHKNSKNSFAAVFPIPSVSQ